VKTSRDGTAGVGRNFVLVVVVERHLHLVAGALDAVDRTDRHAHDLNPVARIQGKGLGEIRHDAVVGQLLVHGPADEASDDRQYHDHRAGYQCCPRNAGQLEVSDVGDHRHRPQQQSRVVVSLNDESLCNGRHFD
jgi:hypothetical protein